MMVNPSFLVEIELDFQRFTKIASGNLTNWGFKLLEFQRPSQVGVGWKDFQSSEVALILGVSTTISGGGGLKVYLYSKRRRFFWVFQWPSQVGVGWKATWTSKFQRPSQVGVGWKLCFHRYIRSYDYDSFLINTRWIERRTSFGIFSICRFSGC